MARQSQSPSTEDATTIPGEPAHLEKGNERESEKPNLKEAELDAEDKKHSLEKVDEAAVLEGKKSTENQQPKPCFTSLPREIRVLIAEHLTSWSDLTTYWHLDTTNTTLLSPTIIAYIKKNPLSESQRKLISLYSELLTGTSTNRECARSLFPKLLKSAGIRPELIMYPEFKVVRVESAADEDDDFPPGPHEEVGTDLKWGRNRTPEGIGRDEVRGRNLLEILRRVLTTDIVFKVEGVTADTIKQVITLAERYIAEARRPGRSAVGIGLSYYLGMLKDALLQADVLVAPGYEVRKVEEAWKLIQCDWMYGLFGGSSEAAIDLTANVMKRWMEEVQSFSWFRRELLRPELIQQALGQAN
ncbi:hypothetical protein BJ508DRAFT_91170 [Ascobolus immersus RN42]|uniref:Uncharacterized protein n=1 Tax=Ascobolus immersus RN42 TaxID=1160509 RepID=A0A3N4IA65_ASCIM|nr:hypothetical protein BJ508DRAFT_91170 [Ascobolus immersus RN42]